MTQYLAQPQQSIDLCGQPRHRIALLLWPAIVWHCQISLSGLLMTKHGDFISINSTSGVSIAQHFLSICSLEERKPVAIARVKAARTGES